MAWDNQTEKRNTSLPKSSNWSSAALGSSWEPRSRSLGRSDCRDNVLEFGLERGAADEEAVDIWLRRERSCVRSVGRAAVLDTDGPSDFGRLVLTDQAANALVRRLRVVRRGCEASANSPDGLIGDDHLCRVEHAIDLRELHVHLREDSFEAPLADLLGLPDAEAARHARVEDVSELCRQRLVGIHSKNAKLSAALRVSDQHLRDAHVLHLLYRHLARVGATALEVAVLGCDFSAVRELVRAVGGVQRRRTDVHVAPGRIARVEVRDEAVELGDRVRIALPH